MGLLKKLAGLFRSRAAIRYLPSGTITVDREGRVMTSTVSSNYPSALLGDIGRNVLALFLQAHEAQIPLAELSIHYGSLRITARELRGGAIIFLSPLTSSSSIST
jgi:hypothetical protein